MALEDWFLAHARVSSKVHKRISLDDKVSLFQQLATLVASGTPILQAIEISAQQSQSTALQEVLADVGSCIAAGSSLHGAMAQHPTVFEPHWMGIIETGEISGNLGSVLLDLNQQITEQRATRGKLIGAMIYPITLVVIAVAAVAVMLWLVVPTFATMFKDMGAELPAITQFVVSASDVILAYGLYVLAGLGLAGFLFQRYLKTDSGRRRVTACAMATPVIGPLLIQSAMYRFASHTALLLKSGVPMLEALETLNGVFHGNPIYRDAIEAVHQRVSAGRSLADSMEHTGLFTSMLTNMIRIGEESGQLATVMEQIAPYYKEKVEASISKTTKLMEPAIIIIMGTTIATVMMSIYLPMFELSGKVQ